MIWRLSTTFWLLSLAALVLGCSAGGPAPEGDHESAEAHGEDAHAGHAHAEHAHAGHDHETGPNGGHVLVLGDEAYHAEWLHDDDAGKLTVVLLDGQMQGEVATTAESVAIELKLAGSEAKRYELPAVNRSQDDPPTASRFELIEPALVTGLQLGEGVEATLHVEIDGEAYAAPIEHQAHGDDGHAGHNH